jgi:hypothetical protein
MSSKEGSCHICGQYGKLSFEHVPPKAAFNERRVIAVTFEKALELGPDGVPKGPIQQSGMGSYTLCERCNNNTGHWYGGRFVEWCYQGMNILIRANGHPSLIYLQHLFPLAILKQIVTMMFSVNTNGFRIPNQELVDFVLNKESRYLSPKYRFFVYYNTTGNFRSVGISGLANIKTGKTSIMCEISYPPYGYVMTFSSEPPDGRLVEITHFSRYSYNDFVTQEMNMPVLPTILPIPGDYRDKDQIIREARTK